MFYHITSMRKIEKVLPYIAVAIAPAVAAAQGTIQGVLQTVDAILDTLIPILIVIATIVFIWGVIVYITAGSSEEKKNYGKYLIMYGLIGLFAIVAIWGVVKVLANTFGVGTTPIPPGPGVI